LNPTGQVPNDWSPHKKTKLMSYKGLPVVNLYNWMNTFAREETRFSESLSQKIVALALVA
jgi:hypothetical protein